MSNQISKHVYILSRDDLYGMLRHAYRDAQMKQEFDYTDYLDRRGLK